MKHKVFDILKTFSIQDTKNFKDFLTSPFFNNSKKLIKLYDVLLNYYPNFALSHVTDEELSKFINPSLPFNKSTTKVLFSKLNKQCGQYFRVTNFLNKEVESSDFLRDELFKRKLYRGIEDNIENTEQLLEPNHDLNANYCINKFKLATDKANLFHICISKSNKKLIYSDTENIAERGRYLVYFFITEIIREYDNLISIAKTYCVLKKDNLILELFSKINILEILDFLILREENRDYLVTLEIYKALLNSILHFDDVKSYFEYKKVLIKNIEFLSIDEKRFHFRGLIKNCILRREANETSNKVDYELFNLYGFVLENGLYKSSVSEILSIDLYRNVLILSLRLKKYKWAVYFIKKFTNKINPKRRKNIYYYSLAEYYFNRKLYKYALLNFHKIKNDDIILKMDMRNQMLIANYELSNYEAALSMVESYYFFLSHNDALSPTQKQLYKNFVKIVHKLILYNTSSNRCSLTEIEMYMKEDIPFREWLCEKVTQTSNDIRAKKYLKVAHNKTIYSNQVKAS